MHLIHLKNVPIFEQLRLEEALLRLDQRNFCLINEGSPPAIVMGISGKLPELVDLAKIDASPIPVLRRFSGGGTVVVDHQTLFISFICQRDLHPFSPYPEPILRWTEQLYQEAFQIDGFALRENDYAIHQRKCGGNAQYLRKERWLHHTTFLWDYDEKMMDYLLHPKKTPAYRQGRSHRDFICRLSEYQTDKNQLISGFKKALASRFPLKEIDIEELKSLQSLPHRQSTERIL